MSGQASHDHPVHNPVEETWVEVSPYNPEWARDYEREATALLAVIGDYVLGIEHFGSTAVTGMWAKPIVDILVGSREGPNPEIQMLEDLGIRVAG